MIKKQIKEEYEKFETIAKGLDNQLCTLLLTDIIASMTNTYKNDEDKNVKDYSKFDEMVNNIKNLLNDIEDIPYIDIKLTAKESVEQANRVFDEGRYSMRTLM